MRAWGATDEDVQKYINDNDQIIEVLSSNWQAVQLSMNLQMDFEVSMAGVIHKGYSRAEISSVFDIYDIKQDKRINLLNRILIIEHEKLKILNAR